MYQQAIGQPSLKHEYIDSGYLDVKLFKEPLF